MPDRAAAFGAPGVRGAGPGVRPPDPRRRRPRRRRRRRPTTRTSPALIASADLVYLPGGDPDIVPGLLAQHDGGRSGARGRPPSGALSSPGRAPEPWPSPTGRGRRRAGSRVSASSTASSSSPTTTTSGGWPGRPASKRSRRPGSATSGSTSGPASSRATAAGASPARVRRTGSCPARRAPVVARHGEPLELPS